MQGQSSECVAKRDGLTLDAIPREPAGLGGAGAEVELDQRYSAGVRCWAPSAVEITQQQAAARTAVRGAVRCVWTSDRLKRRAWRITDDGSTVGEPEVPESVGTRVQ